MEYDQLKLDQQICFPVYAASRLITKAYQPLLENLGLTYPQYLVLMVLWETDSLSVNGIAERLILNTNTITPLLKRMEAHGLLERQRSSEDERRVIIKLTDKGTELRHKAAEVPIRLMEGFSGSDLSQNEITALKETLLKMIELLK
ncbi:MAG: MarR family transcriptional regulator [Spirochaetales bacterium]|uniref:MarR family transcriptional regulator n=1 Tax=Candidatus Thalassospirochaeta sargassi TaxID=3119039 RepID=A0AAJ1IHL6_9SPIO|nr:MarR family transcriptional regulator [Spirochaetales bacterium]